MHCSNCHLSSLPSCPLPSSLPLQSFQRPGDRSSAPQCKHSRPPQQQRPTDNRVDARGVVASCAQKQLVCGEIVCAWATATLLPFYLDCVSSRELVACFRLCDGDAGACERCEGGEHYQWDHEPAHGCGVARERTAMGAKERMCEWKRRGVRSSEGGVYECGVREGSRPSASVK